MEIRYVGVALVLTLSTSAHAQSKHEAPLCEAAKTSQVVELVYDKDASKACLPRLVDVHQVAIGHNGKLYMHGWQSRGCTKGRDYASRRIFRFDKITGLQKTINTGFRYEVGLRVSEPNSKLSWR